MAGVGPSNRDRCRLTIVIALAALAASTVSAVPPPPDDELPEFVDETIAERLTTRVGGRIGTAVAYVGNHSLIGAPQLETNRGGVYSYVTDNVYWYARGEVFFAPDTVAQDWFGRSVALAGLTGVVGAPAKDEGAGAVYVFVRDVSTSTYDYSERVDLPGATVGDECGDSLAIQGHMLFVSCPYDDHEFDNQGVVRVLFRDALEDLFSAWTQVTELRPLSRAPGQSFGISLAAAGQDLDGNFTVAVIVGSDSAHGGWSNSGAAWVFETDWTDPTGFVEVTKLQAPDAHFRMEFGRSVDIDLLMGPRAVVGAPREGTGDLEGAGAAYTYFKDSTTGEYEFVKKLVSKERARNDLFGRQVAISDNSSVVCAPRADPVVNDEPQVDAGMCYFFRHNESGWLQVTKVIAVDPQPSVLFGETLVLQPTGSILGAPQRAAFQGAVYFYAGYEFFPIQPPVLIPDSGSFLINTPFKVFVETHKPTETVYYNVNAYEPPDLFDDIVDPETRTMTLPAVEGVYDVRTLTSNIRLGKRFLSVPIRDVYYLWVATPGRYWTGARLVECGAPDQYCPGVFEDPNRYEVTYGHYSVPESAGLAWRSDQTMCEPDYYCVGGVRFRCGTPFCWPEPAIVSASESDDPLLRQPGLGVGDRLTIVWTNRTNQIPLPSSQSINRLLRFTASLGDALEAAWLNESALQVTLRGDTTVADPWLTRVHTLGVRIHPSGELRMVDNYTQPSDSMDQDPFVLSYGTWGDHHKPYLVSATADYSRTETVLEHGAGPGWYDTLVIKWDSYIDWSVPVATQQDIDALLEFVPPITDVTYTGEWISWTELRITFGRVPDNDPDLAVPYSRTREQWSVGSLVVRMRLPSPMRSRDRSSGFVEEATPVVVNGTWGDVADNLYIAYDSPSSLSVTWSPPGTKGGYNTTQYRIQLATLPAFEAGSIVVDDIVTADPEIEAAGLEGMYVRTYALEVDVWYWARVSSFNLIDWGPNLATRPTHIQAALPNILDMLSSPLIVTQGEVVTFRVGDLGRGPLAGAMDIVARYDNRQVKPRGFHRSYLTDDCWLEPTSGSILYCQTRPGVGTAYRWNITVRGYTSNTTTADIVTNYRRPVVYEFDDFTPGAVDALSSGNQLIRLEGANFGTVGDNAIVQVTYWPNLHASVVFFAQQCNVTVDHHEIRCLTGPGAGEDLRWAVTVEDQTSIVVSTSYGAPVIHSIQLLEPGDRPDELDSNGDEIVVLSGVNFGPDRSDIPLIVKYWGLAPQVGGVHESVVTPTRNETHYFVAPHCRVVATHTTIHCRTAPGYAIEPATWTLEILDQVSPQFAGTLYYGSPRLEEVVAGSYTSLTPTQGGPRTFLGRNFAADHPELVSLTYRGSVIFSMTHLSHYAVNFTVPPGTGVINMINITVNGVVSNSINFRYLPPVIEELRLKWQQPDQLAPWAVAAGHDDESWRDGEGRTHGALAADGSFMLDDDQWPWWHLRSHCLEIEVLGNNFGLWPERANVFIRGSDLAEVPNATSLPVIGCTQHDASYVQHNSVLCCTDARRGSIFIDVDGQISAAVVYEIDELVPKLQLDSVSPNITHSFGEVLTLRGKNFLSGGMPRGGVTVRGLDEPHYDGVRVTRDDGGIDCAVLTYADSIVTCRLQPTDWRFSRWVSISVHTFSFAGRHNLSSNVLPLEYFEPEVTRIDPESLPARGGVIELWGTSFGHWRVGDERGGNVHLIPDAESTDSNFTLCRPVIEWNHTHVTCFAPPATGNRSVAVHVGWSRSKPFERKLQHPISPERLVFSHTRAVAPQPLLLIAAAWLALVSTAAAAAR